MAPVEHAIATKGFGSGTNDFYDRARPSYPAEAVHQIYAALPKDPATAKLNIVELGSGTGLFSRLLISPPTGSEAYDAGMKPVSSKGLEYPKWSIGSLYAVEPSAGMRAAWDAGHAKLLSAGKVDGKAELKTVAGGFEDLSGLKDERKTKGLQSEHFADLVVIAQAWHWAEPRYDQAIEEFHFVLKPDGIIVFVWNNEFREPPYPQALKHLEWSLENGTPQQRLGKWKATFEGDFYKQHFSAPETKWSRWETVVNDEKIMNRLFSKSYIAARSDDEKKDIAEQITSILVDSHKKEDEWVYVDKKAGTYTLAFDTEVVIMRRKAE